MRLLGKAFAGGIGHHRDDALLLPPRLQVSGGEMVVGPFAALNFPWVLLDRAIGTLAFVMQRAHARRDRVTVPAERLRELLQRAGLASTAWPEADRKACEQVFAQVRRGRLQAASQAALRQIVGRHLDALAGAPALDA